MNEPKKELLIAAAKKRFASPVGMVSHVAVNHRKHTMRVTIDVEAKSHADLLKKLVVAG